MFWMTNRPPARFVWSSSDEIASNLGRPILSVCVSSHSLANRFCIRGATKGVQDQKEKIMEFWYRVMPRVLCNPGTPERKE